jgi:hypothetical protein
MPGRKGYQLKISADGYTAVSHFPPIDLKSQFKIVAEN